METFSYSLKNPISRTPVISRQSRPLCQISDKRQEAALQAKMLHLIQGTGQEGHVAQCRLTVDADSYETQEDVADMFAHSDHGWDDRWAVYVDELLEQDETFLSIQELAEFLEGCIGLEYRDMLRDAHVRWNPAWADAFDMVAKRPVYTCRSAPELVGLLDKLAGGYFKPVEYKSGYRSEKKYPTPKSYVDASGDKMNERDKRPLMSLSLADKGYLFHGTPVDAARAIQQSGFLSPADPSFRNALDATKDGFLSFATSGSMAVAGIKLRMKISQGDITRWQFKQVSPSEVVTTLAVPTYRLEWFSREDWRWYAMDTHLIPRRR